MLLIVDEVQTGFGRTGKLFASDGHYHTTPDVLVMAKGLASGLPLAAIATRAELADQQPAGSMGGTYAGNAVACASAIATLDVIKDEGLVENAAVQGAHLRAALTDVVERDGLPVREVRGLGLMVGVELEPSVAPGAATAVSQASLDQGAVFLLSQSSGKCMSALSCELILRLCQTCCC